MALNTNELYLLEHVFSKVEYDETLEKYIIHLRDYLPLKLTEKQRYLLENMCQKNNIELEKLPKRLKEKEAQILFEEYARLKKEISLNPNRSDLKEQALNIRNQLVEGYIELMYTFISTYIIDSENEFDAEVIYQDGYEVLINLIDSYDLNIASSFICYLYYFGYNALKNKAKYIGNRRVTNAKLAKLIRIRQKYQRENGENPTLNVLQEITGFTKNHIENLLKLEEALKGIVSLEELEEIPKQTPMEEKQQYNESLIDYSYEEQMDKILFQILMQRLLNTLTPKQKEVLTMRYGFNNEPVREYPYIATKLKISTQEAKQLHDTAISNLKLPLRMKHLKEIIINYTSYVYPQSMDATEQLRGKTEKGEQKKDHELKRLQKQQKYELRHLAIFLISSFKKEEILNLIDEVALANGNPLSKKILMHALGIGEDAYCTTNEMQEKLNLTTYSYYELRRKSITKLLFVLRQRYSQEDTLMSEEDLVDYLLTCYLNHSKRRTRFK